MLFLMYFYSEDLQILLFCSSFTKLHLTLFDIDHVIFLDKSFSFHFHRFSITFDKYSSTSRNNS